MTDAEARPILGSMLHIALAHGGEGVTETTEAAVRIGFGLTGRATADLTPW